MIEEESGAVSVQGTSDLVAVVDDDPTARRLMRFWLERTGYRVAEHDSARSVLEADGELPTVACVDLGLGEGESVVLGTDLGYGYIDENRTTS